MVLVFPVVVGLISVSLYFALMGNNLGEGCKEFLLFLFPSSILLLSLTMFTVAPSASTAGITTLLNSVGAVTLLIAACTLWIVYIHTIAKVGKEAGHG